MNAVIYRFSRSARSATQPIRHYAGPTHDLPRRSGVSLRLLLGVTGIVTVCYAAGIYWLHHLLPSRLLQSEGVVQVALMSASPAQVPAGQPALTTSQPAPVAAPADKEPASPVTPPQFEPPRGVPVAGGRKPAAVMDRSAATPSPDRAAVSNAAVGFQQALLTHIQHYRRYPEAARAERAEGITHLLFAMGRDGKVLDVWVRTSSGSVHLDQAAVEILRRAEPLPMIPSILPDRLNVLIPIAFHVS